MIASTTHIHSTTVSQLGPDMRAGYEVHLPTSGDEAYIVMLAELGSPDVGRLLRLLWWGEVNLPRSGDCRWLCGMDVGVAWTV